MQVVIDENAANQRFDRFLRKYCKAYPEVKLSDIFSWIRRGAVSVEAMNVEGKRTRRKRKEDYRLQLGDVVMFADDAKLGDKNPIALLGKKSDKKQTIDKKFVQKMINFEDDNWLVFDKPAGVVLHEGNKHENDLSMNDYLSVATSPPSPLSSKLIEGGHPTFKPAFGYRLDKDTSGVLIAAKTYEALQYLNKIIRERKIDKYYLTRVAGKTPATGEIALNLEKGYDKRYGKARVSVKKNGERTAKTAFETVKTINHKELGEISLLRVKIYTGRMHQIRVHLAHIGHPVLGDLMYGNPALNRKLYKVLKINRQLLHCWKYMFWDPYLKQNIELEAKMPVDFRTITK